MSNQVDLEELKGIRRWWAEVRRGWEEALLTNGLLRALVHEPSFLVAVIGVLVCGVGVVVMIPKVWDPAPPGFSRTVRVSLLDYVQAWNLRRTAERARGEGEWNESLVAWRTAMANNLADARLHRGLLGVLRDAPWVHSGNLGLALFSGELLVELGGTNRADCVLVSEVAVRHRLPEVAVQLLRGWRGEFTAEEESVWMRALLLGGDVAGFEAAWRAAGSGRVGDGRLGLYRAALDALGAPGVAVEAMDRLRAAMEDPGTRFEGARLLCWAALRRDDLGSYERGLAVLRELGSSTVFDEAGAWTLLARRDRVEEAREAARGYRGVPPPTPMEAIHLARAWNDLGLGDMAVAMFVAHVERYGLVQEVWATYLDLLIGRRQWDDVRRVSSQLRGLAAGQDDMAAMAWYADAVADLSQERRASARGHLGRLLDAEVKNSAVALRLATGLTQLGEGEVAWKLLVRHEEGLKGVAEYWLRRLMVAQGRRDVEGMEVATERLLALRPGDVLALNVRLGLLLLRRESPAEALALSLQLGSGGAVNAGALINHAAALLQNARTAEAGAVLARLNPGQLTPQERAAWEAARVEYLGRSGRWDEALELGGRIDVAQLMPPDEAWLRDYLAEGRRRLAEVGP